MTTELKQALREAAKRKRGILLKDVPPEELLIGADYAECELGIDDPPIDPMYLVFVAYLKYATKDQVAALEGRIQSVRVRLPNIANQEGKVVVCFNGAVLRGILGRAVSDPEKYMNAPRYGSVPATRPNSSRLESEVVR